MSSKASARGMSVVWSCLDTATGHIAPYNSADTAALEGVYSEMQENGSTASRMIVSNLVNLTLVGNEHVIVDLASMQQRSVTLNEPPKKVFRRLAMLQCPRLSCTLEMCVVETERFFPIIGWGHKRLPTDRPQWADASGHHRATREQVTAMVLESGALSWADPSSDWSLVTSEETDNIGWQYSMDFPQTFHAHKKTTDFVRRRLWLRVAHTTHGLTDAADLKLSPEIDSFVRTKTFSLLTDDVRALRAAEASIATNLKLNATLELNIREVIARDEIEELASIAWTWLHGWCEVDRQDICRAFEQHAAELVTASSEVLDKWVSVKGPRQSAIELRVLSASGVNVSSVRGLGSRHHLRVAVRFLGNDTEVFSEDISMSTNPQFDFKTFTVLPDDTRPILITIEALAHGVVELLSEPVALAVVPLNVRAKYTNLMRTVTPDTLVYKETADVTLNCLDERGVHATTTNIRVSWELEPRDGGFVEFCEGCGSMINRCTCAPEELEARRREQDLKEAQRQAEIYAARADRLAKRQAEEDAERQQQAERLAHEHAEAVRQFILSERESRERIVRAEASAAEQVERAVAVNLGALQKKATRRETLRVFFKIRIDEITDQRTALALRNFALWRAFTAEQQVRRNLLAEQARIQGDIRRLFATCDSDRQALDADCAAELEHLRSSEARVRPVEANAATVPAVVEAVAVSDEQRTVVQGVRRTDKDKSGCCAVM